MNPVPRIASLACAVPPHALEQKAVVERVVKLFRGRPELDRLLPVFANSAIDRRYSAVPLEWFDQSHGWRERSRRYADTALDLLETACGRALDHAGLKLSQVGALVVVSTTGIATPSLDALLIERMRLPRDTVRLPIFGLGCAGGVIGLAHAATLVPAIPERAVVLAVVELCSLTFRRDDASKSNIVGAALFGDGAAAAVLQYGGRGPAVLASGEHTWPHSLDIMGWDVMEDGLKPLFSRDIPALATRDLGDVARDFLARHGATLADLDRVVCHPGGPKVIDAVEHALGLGPGALHNERQVLRDFGNMSAATVLFVLDRMLNDGTAWRRALLTAFGPGFTAGFVMLGGQ